MRNIIRLAAVAAATFAAAGGSPAASAEPYPSRPNVRGGAIKAYAVLAKDRMAVAPDLPTSDEAGLPEFYFSVWAGMWVPKGAPREIIGRLTAGLRDALADPAIRQRLAALAIEAPPPGELGPEKLGALHKAEIEKWWPIIKAAGIKEE